MTSDAEHLATVSPDGQWEWNGAEWVARAPQPQASPPPFSVPPNRAASHAAPTSTTNGLAIVSLVFGVVWLGGLGSLPAIILGLVALSQIKRTHQAGRGLAIAGVVLGTIGLLIPIALVALAMLAGSSQQDKVDDAMAKTEVRSIMVAQETYYTDNGEYASSAGELESQGWYTPSSATSIGPATTTSTGSDTYSVRVESLSGQAFCANMTSGVVECP